MFVVAPQHPPHHSLPFKEPFLQDDIYRMTDQQFSKGQLVLAPWNHPSDDDDDDDDELYVAKIAKVNLHDGTYDLWYMDGDFDTHVPGENLVALDVRPHEVIQRPPITIGLAVCARYYGELSWDSNGVVAGIDGDDHYEIHYDDGDKEILVPAKYIKFQYDHQQPVTTHQRISANHSSIGNMETHPYFLGQNVWAQYEGEEEYFEAKIVKLNDDGTYDLHYMDGEKESNVDAMYLYPIDLTQHELTTRPPIQKGCWVTARYFGGTEWFDGVVTDVNEDGTFEIDFDDGDKESLVEPKYVRVLESQEEEVNTAAISMDVPADKGNAAGPMKEPSSQIEDTKKKVNDDAETVISQDGSNASPAPPTTQIVAVECPCRCTIL